MLTEWDESAPVDYTNAEIHIFKDRLRGIVADMSLPCIGERYVRPLPEPPIPDLNASAEAGVGFGESGVRLYGRRLFEWLFDERLRDGLRQAKIVVGQTPSNRLRLHLRLSDELPPMFQTIRWEAMVYLKDDWVVSLETAFARTRASVSGSPLLADRPLRLFGTACEGIGEGTGQSGDSFRQLLPAFAQSERRPLGELVQARFASGPLTLAHLRRICEEDDSHFFALCAPFGEVAGEPAVWLDADGGGAEPTSWAGVAQMISRSSTGAKSARRPSVVVILGWPVKKTGGPTQMARLAKPLLDNGVRAVLELVAPMPVDHFTAFTESMLRRFLTTGALDDAVAGGRRRLFALAPREWGWASAVLSLNATSDAQQFYLLPEGLESLYFTPRGGS